MYEDMTYDTILATAMKEVSDDVQKGEGSLVYNALSVLAYEVEKAYTQLDYVIEQSHADTADLDNLKLVAADRAIDYEEATSAVVSITANVALPIGWRGSLKGYNYCVTEAIDEIDDDLETLNDYIEEVDDFLDEIAEQLAGLVKPLGGHVNLIPLNHVEESRYGPSTKGHMKCFIKVLEDSGVNYTVRRRLGGDIDASCGQLRRKFEKSREK